MMHIGLLGFGVVGGGVWALCAPRDDLNVKRVLLRSPKEGLPEEVVTFNADDILNDPEIDTVVEVMGGLHPAYEYVSAALARGKNELRPFGITVCAVQPGDIHTGFTAAREKTVTGDEVYGGRISRSVSRMEHDEQTGMDPAAAGRFIARVAQKTSHKPIYTIRLDYQFFVFLKRILPYRALNALIGLIYAK